MVMIFIGVTILMQYITAQLNNYLTLRGWLGFYQFKEGDEVEVVAEKHADHYEV